MQRGSTVNFHLHVDPGGGGLTMDTERINSQLSSPHEKAITSVDLGGMMIDAGRIKSTFTWKIQQI